MTWIEWYDSLVKPSWTPAPATISLIWTVLYPVILISFGFVFVQAFRGKLPWRVTLPFAVNLAANLLFMPIFAGLRSVPLAAVDIIIVWATTIWCVVAVWPHSRWVAIVQVPYFAWVSVAAVLQLSITAMNR
jgi:benzodiazapine receptor